MKNIDGSQPKNSKIYKPIDLIKHNLVKQIQNMIYDKGSIDICCSWRSLRKGGWFWLLGEFKTLP